MSRIPAVTTNRVVSSILDRLLDDEPEISREPIASRAQSVAQLKASVQGNLDWLLNTRRSSDIVGVREERLSLVSYGLPDFSLFNVKSPSDRERMRRQIEATVSAFEPRLGRVVVTVEPLREGDRVMRFRLDAYLRIHPVPEPVIFDMQFQPERGDFEVGGE